MVKISQTHSQDLEYSSAWLFKVCNTMLKTKSLSQLVHKIADLVLELSQAEEFHIWLREPGSVVLNHHFGCKGAMKSATKSAIKEGSEQPSLAAKVLAKANSKIEKEAKRMFDQKELRCLGRNLENTTDSTTWFQAIAGEQGFTGIISFSKAKDFTGEKQSLITQFAELASAAIDNAKTFERIQNDPLTGLPNATAFILHLDKAIKDANFVKYSDQNISDNKNSSTSTNTNIGVLLLDLDHFKRINNKAGAEMGDQALIDIANTLKDILRADGLVSRFGSDKFGVLLAAEDSRADLRLYDAAERARAAIRAKTYHGIDMSVCIGAASTPNHTITSAGDLIALAENALSKARAKGHGSVEISWQA